VQSEWCAVISGTVRLGDDLTWPRVTSTHQASASASSSPYQRHSYILVICSLPRNTDYELLPGLPGCQLRACACTQTGSDVWLLSARAHQVDINYKHDAIRYVNSVDAPTRVQVPTRYGVPAVRLTPRYRLQTWPTDVTSQPGGGSGFNAQTFCQKDKNVLRL